MHRFIIATVMLLVAPATAFAVTTTPAQPPTISLTAAGAPRCTKLPYALLSLRHKVILRRLSTSRQTQPIAITRQKIVLSRP